MILLVSLSFFTFLELANLTSFLPKKAFKTILGYSWILEVVVSIGLPAIAAASGTITGFAVSILAGFLFTSYMGVMKKIHGTRKYKRKEGWIETEGMSVASFIKGVVNTIKDRTSGFAKEMSHA